MKRNKWTRHTLIWCMLLIINTAHCQVVVTKSGTPVTAAPRTPAVLAERKASPLPHCQTETYIVVTRQELLAPLHPLLQWKSQQGYHVETLITEADADGIRQLLKTRYEATGSGEAPQRYVLIVGDVEQIPSFQGRHVPAGLGNHATDMYYGEYTGDYVPEAWVGRLSASSLEELATVTGKIIAYEQGRYCQTRQLLIAAGKEERNPAPTTTNGQVNYLAEMAKAAFPEMDTLCYRNPESDSLAEEVISHLTEANALVNYTGHCTRTGWNNPMMTAEMTDSATWTTPTVFVNNCCLSNAYNGTCLGEELLRRPTGGAVGVIGATNETLWAEDYYWAVGAKYPLTAHPAFDSTLGGAFDPMLSHEDYTLGRMLDEGCRAVTLAGSAFDAFYWETYCLIGDPSMTLFIGTADSLTLTVADTVMKGSKTLCVQTSPYARVAATEGERLIGSATADSLGKATLSLWPAVTADTLVLTATRPNAIACCTTRTTTRHAEGRLTITDGRIADNSHIVITTANVGNSNTDGHRMMLYQNDEDRTEGETAVTDTTAYVMEADTTTVSVVMGRHGREVMFLHAILADADGNVYDTTRIVLHGVPQGRWTGLAVTDSEGDEVGELHPGTPYLIAASVSDTLTEVTMAAEEEALPLDHTSTDSLTHYFAFSFPATTERIALEGVADGHDTLRGWLLPNQAWERFETGDLSLYPWEHNSLHPWKVTSGKQHSGTFCAQSGTIAASQQSVLLLNVNVLKSDSIVFFHQESSEGHDWLTFYIDGKRCGYWSGKNGWRRYARLLPKGRHELTWSYAKDGSVDEGEDCARIDDIRLPLCLWDEPCGASEQAEQVGTDAPTADSSPLSIHPNPARGVATICFTPNAKERKMRIYDCYGRLVDEIFIPANCHFTQYSTTHLRFGIYSVVIDHEVIKMIIT